MIAKRLLIAVAASAVVSSIAVSAGAKQATPEAEKVRAFVGDVEGLYLTSEVMPLSTAIIAALGGPPDEPQVLANGHVLMSACRPHSCAEKAGVIVDDEGDVEAAGLVHFNCGPTREGTAVRSGSCRSTPVATMVTSGDTDASDLAALRRWAASQNVAETMIEVSDR